MHLLIDEDIASAPLIEIARRERPACVIEVVSAPVAAHVASALGRAGSAPVVCLITSEDELHAALRAGADEAEVWSAPTTELRDLLERAEARAEHRASAIPFADAGLGRVLGQVAHELNNPLGALMLALDAVEEASRPVGDVWSELERLAEHGKTVGTEDLDQIASAVRRATAGLTVGESLGDVRDSIDAITGVVRDLRVLAHREREELVEAIDVADAIDAALRRVNDAGIYRGRLERDVEADLPTVLAPREHVTRALVHVLTDAARAMKDDDDQYIGVSARTEGEMVHVVISDTGPPITPQSGERLFDPRITTKIAGRGGTLRLPVARLAIRRLGGDITLETGRAAKARFVVSLPGASEESIREARSRGVLRA